MDWAEQVVERIFERGHTSPEVHVMMIVALRKAKADGVRQAAKYAESARHYEHIMQVADEIEKGG